MTVELTVQNFETTVLNSEVPVLVDFWAEWCPPCKKLLPTVHEFADESDGSYKVGKINVDEQGELAEKYRIQAIPTLLVFSGGQVVKRVSGMLSKSQMLELVQQPA